MTEQECDRLYCLNRKILVPHAEFSGVIGSAYFPHGRLGNGAGVSVYFPGCQNRFILKLNNKSAGLVRTPQYAVTLSPTLHVHKCT